MHSAEDYLMPYKTILVLLNGTNRTQQLLDAASAMARQFDAHVIGLYVLPAAQVYSEVGMLATPILFEGYRDLFKSKLEEVRKKFEARVKQDGLKAEWRAVDSNYPDIAESAIAHSRGAELVITSQIERGPDEDIERDLVVRLILESGRPVLIIPKQGHLHHVRRRYCRESHSWDQRNTRMCSCYVRFTSLAAARQGNASCLGGSIQTKTRGK
jgi:hypothetical protein